MQAENEALLQDAWLRNVVADTAAFDELAYYFANV